MKIKFIVISLIVCLGFAMASVNLSGCAAGGHIGPIGGSARIS